MSQNPSCEMCGGTDYRLDSGFYFCAECNLQSQEFQEQIFEDYYKGAKSTVVTIEKTSAKKRAKKEETSWELLNYILKGLTDELIELGAPKSLKKTVLRLWVTYLSRLEVAFISKDEELKPRLSIGFKSRDANIIYGELSKPKRKRRRSRSESSLGSLRSQKRASTSSKKALAKAVYDQTTSQCDIPSNTDASTLPSRNLKFTSTARKLLAEEIAELALRSDEDDGDVEPLVTKLKNKYKQITHQKKSSVENVTLTKVVDLIILALKVERVDLYKSDFLSWMEDGKLSLAYCEKFIPPDVQIAQLSRKPTNLSTSDSHLSSLMKLLRIERSSLFVDPLNGLSGLLKKYCQELFLPEDVQNVIWTLMSNEIPKIDLRTESDSDSCVVSFILISLKLMFGLDDVTERSIAPFTREGKLSWEEWVQLRVRFLAHQALSHYPTRIRHYRNSFEGNPHDNFLLLAGSNVSSGGFDQLFEKAAKRILPLLIDDKDHKNSAPQNPHLVDHRELDSYLDLEERLKESKDLAILKRLGGNFTYMKRTSFRHQSSRTDAATVEIVKSSSLLKSQNDMNRKSKSRRKNIMENLRDVYLPGHQYWIIHSTQMRTSIQANFDGDLSIQERLPVSFYWLLNQLSGIARRNSVALYAELVKYESLLFYPETRKRV